MAVSKTRQTRSVLKLLKAGSEGPVKLEESVKVKSEVVQADTLILVPNPVKLEEETERVKAELDEVLGSAPVQAASVSSSVKVKTEESGHTVQITSNLKFETFYSSPPGGRPNDFPPVSPSDVTPSQPQNWDKIYNELVRMRGLIVTPVDFMGCERLPDTINAETLSANPVAYRFQLLIALMLSAQTKDETNFQAMQNLLKFAADRGYPCLSLETLLEALEAEIDQCICKVGFHRRKAMYIKKSCELLRSNFGGDVPKTIEEIVTLPGVGPKMGHLLLQNGWKVNSGIGVDVHIHRLAQMWRWVPKTDKPEVTRKTLEDWLPPKYWADINPLLVGFGQTVCTPQVSNCDICVLSLGLCKGAKRMGKGPLSDARRAKLAKLRGDLSGLIALRDQQDLETEGEARAAGEKV